MADAQESTEQEIDLEALAKADSQEQEQQEDQQEQVEFSAKEQEAFDIGWRPENEYNGPKENWKTAKEYIRDGEWLAQIKSLKQDQERQKKDFDDRLENTNKLHEARRRADIKKLKAQQREAVDGQDTEAFDHAQTQIDELEGQEVKTTTTTTTTETDKDPVIAAWEEKNPWINDLSDERGSVAVGIYNTYASQNKQASTAQVLAHVDGRMDKLYPTNTENPRRNQPNTTENNTRRSSRQSKGLSMGDLTAEEKQDYALFGSQMFTEAEFLKTVADTRAK